MDFTAEHYFRAALERIAQAQDLYRPGTRYALSMYTAGVAVECMLRAFRLKKTPAFEGRHDILLLFKESGMLQVAEETLKARGISHDEIDQHLRTIQTAANQVFALWHNNYRYASQARLLAHLKHLKLYEGVRG